MGALSEFAITEQYKGLIHYLLTILFVDINPDDYEKITEKVFDKLEALDKFKQFLFDNGGDRDEILLHALQFILIVENILLTRKIEEG